MFADAVQFFLGDGEHDARSIILLIGIFQIACASQDFQGTVGLYGKVPEVTAEFIDIEREGAASSVSHGHLVIEVDVFVNFLDITFLGKCIAYPLFECDFIAGTEQQYGIGFHAVSSSSSGFLKVGFGRVGHIGMDNHAYVWFVNSHTKGIGGYHYTEFSFQPGFLSGIFGLVVESGMIKSGCDVVAVQELGNLFRLFPVAGIDNSRPVDALQDVEQFAFLVFRMTYHVGQVLPFKAHAEHIFLAELKALLDVADHFRSGSGRQCDDGNFRE